MASAASLRSRSGEGGSGREETGEMGGEIKLQSRNDKRLITVASKEKEGKMG